MVWCRLTGDVRVFRLDRIVSAAVFGEWYPEPGPDRIAELAVAIVG